MTKVTIYTDGGADPNPGYGGWGAILLSGKHRKELSGNAETATNNRMELTAAIEALKALKKECEVDLYTDSQYLRLGITERISKWEANGWQQKGGKEILNKDLWQELLPLTKKHTIEWHWVKGHSDNPMNERADELATEARMKIMPKQLASADDIRIYAKGSCIGSPGFGIDQFPRRHPCPTHHQCRIPLPRCNQLDSRMEKTRLEKERWARCFQQRIMDAIRRTPTTKICQMD